MGVRAAGIRLMQIAFARFRVDVRTEMYCTAVDEESARWRVPVVTITITISYTYKRHYRLSSVC